MSSDDLLPPPSLDMQAIWADTLRQMSERLAVMGDEAMAEIAEAIRAKRRERIKRGHLRLVPRG